MEWILLVVLISYLISQIKKDKKVEDRINKVTDSMMEDGSWDWDGESHDREYYRRLKEEKEREDSLKP